MCVEREVLLKAVSGTGGLKKIRVPETGSLQ